MKHCKGFTLVELLVLIIIIVCIALLFMGGCHAVSNNDMNSMLYPEYHRNTIEERKAAALEEQNRLMREQLELQKGN